MKCCYSCSYWEKASRKVPIDVRKVFREGDTFEVRLAGKSVKIRAWEWELVRPLRLTELLSMRLCIYGEKGIVTPWSECGNYSPKLPSGFLICHTEEGCRYSCRCPKLQALTSYIT